MEHESRHLHIHVHLSSSNGFLWECNGSVVECLTLDRGAVGSSLTGITAL